MIAPDLRSAYLAMAERLSNDPPRVWRDVLTLPDARIPRDEQTVWRALAMLTAIAPVLEGRACLTRYGASYCGIRWDDHRARLRVWWH